MNKHLNKMFSLVTIMALMLVALPMQSVGAVSPNIVISQVYGGGGNLGATYTHDFIELFNRGTSSVSLAGWSVQYASATGTGNFGSSSTQITELPAVSVAPGQYLLIQEAQGSGGTTPLPTPDVTDPSPIAMSGTGAKVALVNTTTPLGCNGSSGQPCSPSALATIVDLVGWDGANFYEGAGPAPATTNSTAVLRSGGGCTDTDNNLADFTAGAPTPRNTTSPLNTCPTGATLSISDVSANEGNAGTTSFDFTVNLSAAAGTDGVTFDIATQDGTATVAGNDYVANSVTGGSIAEGSSSYTFSVLVNGDTTVEPNETFFVNVTNVTGATVSDGQAVGTILNDDITITPIYDIQGAGHISPYSNMEVRTTGVVTAVAFNGYYAQDPVGDGDPNTSDGIFVFKSSPRPSVGDLVQLTDTVTEFVSGGCGTGNLSITQLSPTTANQVVLSSGNPLPAPTVIGLSGRIPPNIVTISDDELPVNLQPSFCTGGGGSSTFDPDNDGIDFYESLEGMLVTVEDAVAVSAVRSFGNFSSELFTLPNNGHPDIIEPNTARTDRGGINLAGDPDGYGDLNPERVQIQFDASDITTGTLYPSSVPEINLGDRLGDVTGVMDYDFGNFEVRAIEVVTVVPSGLQPESTILVGTPDHVTVASYNVLNLSPQSSDDNQRAMLASQIVNNLGSPDVIALQEIQDNSGETDDGTTAADQTLRALADAITAAGGPSYDFLDVAPADGTSGGVPGGNIRNAFLYNPDRVQLDSFVSLTPDVLTSAGVGNPNAFFDNRNPLAATFIFGGEAFTVINNHLSSRSGSTPIFGGPQPFVQAAEGEREAQTQALNDYVDFLLRADKNARVIVVGDFNTFEFTDDLTEILPGTRDGKAIMKSLLSEIEDDNRYTFIFDGNSQILDHMFATRSLLENAEFDIVHVNADFALLRADIAASDHEPIVARFNFGG